MQYVKAGVGCNQVYCNSDGTWLYQVGTPAAVCFFLEWLYFIPFPNIGNLKFINSFIENDCTLAVHQFKENFTSFVQRQLSRTIESKCQVCDFIKIFKLYLFVSRSSNKLPAAIVPWKIISTFGPESFRRINLVPTLNKKVTVHQMQWLEFHCFNYLHLSTKFSNCHFDPVKQDTCHLAKTLPSRSIRNDPLGF